MTGPRARGSDAVVSRPAYDPAVVAKRACIRCGRTLSKTAAKRGRRVCPECEKRWTGTHYARNPVKDGDAMERRLPGSFESQG